MSAMWKLRVGLFAASLMLAALPLGEPRHRLLEDQRLEMLGLGVLGERSFGAEDLSLIHI